MHIKLLYFKWFWLYRLALVSIGIAIYWQYAYIKKMKAYSSLNGTEINHLEWYNRKLLEAIGETKRVNDDFNNTQYLRKVTIIDSLSKEYNNSSASGIQFIEQIKTQIPPEYKEIREKLDSLTMMPVSSPILNSNECNAAGKIRQMLSCHAFYTWCSMHVYTECWSGFFWAPYPAFLSPLSSKVKVGEWITYDLVTSGRTGYDCTLNYRTNPQLHQGIGIIDTIFPHHGMIPLIFDINVHVFKNDGRTHHTDTIYLEVLPTK